MDEPEFSSLPNTDDELSLRVNGTVYRLSDDLTDHIEGLAESLYDENEHLSYYWRVADAEDARNGRHEKGDPLLCIDTSGVMVPWQQLSEFEIEVEEDSPGIPGGSDDTTATDNGNGVQTVDPDESDDDESVEDFKMPMFPEQYRPIPDPDDDDAETMPPSPERFDEDGGPIVNMPVPENERQERWDTGRSMVPLSTTVEWNLQRRADTTHLYGPEDGGHSHDEWEQLLELTDCEVTGHVQASNPPSEDDADPDSIYDEESDKGGKYQGNNWQI